VNEVLGVPMEGDVYAHRYNRERGGVSVMGVVGDDLGVYVAIRYLMMPEVRPGLVPLAEFRKMYEAPK
jgi:hypothetical protein